MEYTKGKLEVQGTNAVSNSVSINSGKIPIAHIWLPVSYEDKNKREADWWTRHDVNGRRTIRCKVNKKDIVAIGEQIGLCIVTTQFWCPKPK